MYFQIIKVKRNIICLILLFHEQGKEYEYEFQESRKLPNSQFQAKKNSFHDFTQQKNTIHAFTKTYWGALNIIIFITCKVNFAHYE